MNFSFSLCCHLKRFFLAIALLPLAGCRCRPIEVDLEKVTIESLASYHVNAPDPELHNPPVGQRLHVTWRLPPRTPLPAELIATLRFRDRTEERVAVTLSGLKGCYTYELIDDEFFVKKGIATYKVELFSGEQLLSQWLHHVWVEKIDIAAPDEREQ